MAGRARRATRGRAVRRGRAALGDRLQSHRRRPVGDDDVHSVRAARRGGMGRRRARALRGRVRRAPRPLRAERPRRDPRARGARTAGPGAHLRPGGRLDLPGRAGPRPDGFHAAVADARGLAQYVDARSKGLYLCGAGTAPGGGVLAAAGPQRVRQRILSPTVRRHCGAAPRSRRRAVAASATAPPSRAALDEGYGDGRVGSPARTTRCSGWVGCAAPRGYEGADLLRSEQDGIGAPGPSGGAPRLALP